VLLLLGLWLVNLCAGCAEPPPLDTSLLTGEPCEPPCWQGLTPGESTEEDVAEFMRTTRFVDIRTVYRSSFTRLTRDREEVAGVGIQWSSSLGLGPCNHLSIEEGVLKYITICPYPGVTLGRLIDRYGLPEKYIANLQGYERRWVDVTLFYPTHGFTVDLVLPPDDATLQPESTVADVWYFRAAPLERFIELGWEAGYFGTSPAKWPEFLRDWQGYGPIELD
jgi:hypothetical protein